MASTIPDTPTQPDSDLSLLAGAIFFTIFTALTSWAAAWLFGWNSVLGSIYFLGFEFLFIGIAFDITELFFVLFIPPISLHKISLIEYPPVALLMTTCDDVNPDQWATLKQNYLHCDIFILDDSQDASQRRLVDQSGYTIIRRPRQNGYKAGNLNNWLQLYGKHYKYFVILDSDSGIGSDFVEKMVQYAEHPANEKIAIFQSKIMPTGAKTIFAKAVGSMNQVRFYILERFANRTGLMLSAGHNQLLRTKPVLGLHGFFEMASAEDTALSLMLNASGYTTKLVNIISFDVEPKNILTFTRRITRWAGQTAEIFRFPWKESSLQLKFLLCYHLYNYISPNIYIALILFTSWAFNTKNISPKTLWTFLQNQNHFWLLSISLFGGMVLLWVIQMLLHLYVARCAGVTTKTFFENFILTSSLSIFLIIPVDKAIFSVLLGKPVSFKPTNSVFYSGPPQISTLMWNFSGLFLVVAIISGMFLRNRLLLISLNGLWVFFWALAPFILWFYHRDQI